MITKLDRKIGRVIDKMFDREHQSYKRGYQKGWRIGVKRGKVIGINICMALGRLTAQPKGYYKALSDIITNLEL